MDKQEGTQVIVVTGDVTIDWNIARVQRTDGMTQAWNADDLTCAFCQHGGAMMLADLIQAVVKQLRQSKQAQFEVRQVTVPQDSITPEDKRFHHSYAIWTPFRWDERESDKKKVWRVREFLGIYKAHADTALSETWKKVVDDYLNPGLIVLDDDNLGFRHHPEYWPQALSNDTLKPWILLKMARPVAQGRMWDHLLKNHADRLIVVMTANDLRRSRVHISRRISWERTAQDLMWELLYNPQVNALTQCAHVIVSLGTEGAMLLSRKSEAAPEAVLFFDPNAMEGEWGRYHKGYMIGYNSCLTAGVARELMVNASAPNIPRGIQSGIRVMRFLHTEGYSRFESGVRQIKLAFPASEIAAILAEEGNPLAVTPVENPTKKTTTQATATVPLETSHFWTILGGHNPDLLETIAQQIVLIGLDRALSGIPIGRFGKLSTVDRREIEALHSISSVIREYCQRPQKRPLSIAVFGPPGAGKSFAVEQVANSVLPGEVEPLSFNLSQLGSLDDLIDAFHQVRDKALSGKIPLVFYDEFDTTLQGQQLGWLRYFLAPMQDGEFQEGQIIHPIGQSIFVFAGGTSPSMEDFGANLTDEQRRAVKLPDFVSRLKGFLNILGPNRQKSENRAGRDGDPYYIIRRAIILRSILERNALGLLIHDVNEKTANIDQGLLHAFLLIKEYKHGSRSMEAIIAMSQLAGKTTFERSSLPAESQLNLHVDGVEFYSLMQRMELDSYLLEKLAEKVHEMFCEDMKEKGYKFGPVTLDDIKEHSALVPFADLPENEQEQNRGNARDIQNKLAAVGYTIVPERGDVTPIELSGDEVEKLSKMEHDRWIKQKLADGWKYALTTDKANRLHKDIVPWEKLSENEREKDRVLVRGIPRILGRAGYTMVKS